MTREEEVLFIMKMRDEASRVLEGVGDEFTGVGKDAEGAARSARTFAESAKLAATAAAAAFAAIRGSSTLIRVFSEYEQGMLGVAKTTNLSEEAMAKFSDKFDEMAVRLAVPISSLQEIAVTAGQLGISGSEDILKFTETVAKLETASDLTGEAASFALARISTVTGEGVEGATKLANVIVELGNNFAATESQILHIAQEVARSTTTFNLSSEEVAAYGAAFAQLGVSAEIGGTSVGRTFRAIATAAAEGGDAMKALTKVTGLTQSAFRDLVKESPQEAMEAFLKGLQPVVEDTSELNKVMKALGLSTEEINKTIIPLAKNFEVLADAQARAAEQARDQTALNKEYEQFAKGFASNFQEMTNAVQLFAKELGQSLGPILLPVMDAVTEAFRTMTVVFKALPDGVQTFTTSVLLAVPALYSMIKAMQLAGVTAVIMGNTIRGALAKTGIGLVVLALGSLAAWFLTASNASAELQTGTDNVTLAMKDQINQINILNAATSEGAIMTLDAAESQLVEAKSRKALLEVMIQQYEMRVRESEQYQILEDNLTSLYERKRVGDELLASGSSRTLTDAFREGYQETLDLIAKVEKAQEDLLRGPQEWSDALEDNSTNIERLQNGIENAKSGMVSFGKSLFEALGLAERLPDPLYGAAGAASTLAGNLSVAAQMAATLIANLGKAPRAIADLEAEGRALVAQYNSLAAGEDLVTAAVAKRRQELVDLYNIQDQGMNAGEQAYVIDMINKETAALEAKLRQQEKNNKLIADRRRLESGAGGGGGGGDKSDAERLRDFLFELAKETALYAQQADAIRLKHRLMLDYNIAATDADRISAMIAEARMLGVTKDEIDGLIGKYVDLARARQQALGEGQDFFTQFQLQYQEFGRSLEDATSLAAGVVDAMGGLSTNFLDNMLDENMKFFDALRDAAAESLADIGKMLLDHALKVLVFKNLLGMSTGDFGGVFDAFLSKGAPVGPGGIKEFATGSAFTNTIARSPTMFRYGSGNNVGVMGEDGDEAVMPLTRDRSGNLAVSAVGSGGGTTQVTNMSFVTEVKVAGGGSQSSDAETQRKVGKTIENAVKVTVTEVITDMLRPGGMLSGGKR